MELWELLEIPMGITAVIGGGGKTSLLRALGRELSRRHRVVLCTTTKIYPFPDLPCARTAAELTALAEEPLICTGADAPGGKLTLPPVSLAELARGYDYVLVEADGSAGRPMKAHAAHGPVIPPEARRRLLVVGASGFGCPIETAAHRPERYAALAGAALTDPVTPQTQAAVILAENLHDSVYVNQVETPAAWAAAGELSQRLDCPVTAGSLHQGVFRCLRCSRKPGQVP